MWRCGSCGSAYLGPRPNEVTVHQAYLNYYTHRPVPPPRSEATKQPATLLKQLRQSLAHGYARSRYGLPDKPSSRWGVVAALLLPLRRRGVDREFRHLPGKPDESSGKLLDVGCGEGSFLAVAKRCGWAVVGLEPDPKAALVAQQRGLDIVNSGLEGLESQSGSFDVITLSHVIEHMHEPLETLRSCNRLLKPGGQLWIETPNIDSLGHRVFGRHWRGLEAPRHLVLFSRSSLVWALSQAGFGRVLTLPMPSPRRWLFECSWAMLQGALPEDAMALPKALRRQALWADFRELCLLEAPEFLTVSARKPG
jgi:2-polyprenyl-3-methyl-5-hydroxy-6-metoxy-1,4-benzoquinol methylase